MPMDLFPEEPLISRRLNVAMSRCEPMRPMTSQTWHLPMRELGVDHRWHCRYACRTWPVCWTRGVVSTTSLAQSVVDTAVVRVEHGDVGA
jgi:hypothetical protein